MADWADEKAEEIHREYFSGRDICDGGCRFSKLIAAALRQAVEQEREACAKLADRSAKEYKRLITAPGGDDGAADIADALFDLAADIRARG